MSDIKIEWRKGVFYDIRRMDEVQSWLEAIAEGIAARANAADKTDEYLTSSQQGRKGAPGYQGRWRTTVVTGGDHAKRANAKNNTILKAASG